MAKAGGGKLNRTETVTVRLDPKLNYLCELASRAQRRTKSSFVEWAVAEALQTVEIPDAADFDENFVQKPATVADKASTLWHVDEPDRLVALALYAPSLLTHGEQLIWRHVRENGYIWKGQFNQQDEWTWKLQEASLIRERLREHWETFKAVAAEELAEENLPSWSRKRPNYDDLDDDIPF
ncbi:hypothetical protein A3711_06785 [Erythrobacter sp. HI00D59]|nr:hypothetical protein A3711_06785 [Erythrobacter sp. HI00D59]